MPRKQKGGRKKGGGRPGGGGKGKQKKKTGNNANKNKSTGQKKSNNVDKKVTDKSGTPAKTTTTKTTTKMTTENGVDTNETKTEEIPGPAGSSSSSSSSSTTTTAESTENEMTKSDKQAVIDAITQRKKRRWQVDPSAEHAFWHTQPVPKMKDKLSEDEIGPIETKTLDEVRKTPYLLVDAFEWTDMDLNDQKTLNELYCLLRDHYVEDDDNMFRFNYSKDFLRWALCVPGYRTDWHLGVRVVSTGTLCACITAIPAHVSVHGKGVSSVEINFLCIHKNLRAKRLAPVLIKEITRRVNVQNRWQAVYTAGVVIPTPIAKNRYWHRSLNPKKLIEIQFSALRQRMTMARLLRLYRVDKSTSTPGLREMRRSDCPEVHRLLMNYLKKFKIHIEFSLEEFVHVFMPRKDVVFSYVVEAPMTGEVKSTEIRPDSEGTAKRRITDFFSYYHLPSTVMKNPRYNEMRAAYSYYNVSTKTPWATLMNDALVLAHKQGFDVFNALDVMENEGFFKQLKFVRGDGHLQYYFYNWKMPELPPKEVGVVLL